MKFRIDTLGCKVNTYESNVMSDKLKNKGFIETKENPDIIIINTCTVTNTSDSKSMKMIRKARRENPKAIIVACGCMIQNKKEKIDEVDILLGNIGKSKIDIYIEKYLNKKQKIFDLKEIDNAKFEPMVLNNFNKTRAFVKIQDGCNNFCSYCIIPYTRGNVRSKNKIDVLNEIETLVKNGHKEIVLTGIHTGHYGEDTPNYKFADLLEDIIKIKGIERLRISSIEMTELDEHFLKVLSSSKILVDHMHIPLQSGSNTVLSRMNRKYNIDEFIEKMKEIRKIRPNISITTDVITGFPGETEEEEKETIENIKKINFSKLHVFPYSVRKGTKAEKMDNQIPENIKKERVKKLTNLSKELEIKYMEKFLGETVSVIPEIVKDGYYIGHTGNYLLVKFPCIKELNHEEVNVKISKVEYPYVVGCLTNE